VERNDDSIAYELPDGQLMHFPRRFCLQACESHFFTPNSSYATSDSSACFLLDMCTRLMRACPHELRDAISKNIVLSGGTVCALMNQFFLLYSIV
jgi:hypothetical protein